MTGRVVEYPIDEMNRPRGAKDAQLRIPPSEPEIGTRFGAQDEAGGGEWVDTRSIGKGRSPSGWGIGRFWVDSQGVQEGRGRRS